MFVSEERTRLDTCVMSIPRVRAETPLNCRIVCITTRVVLMEIVANTDTMGHWRSGEKG